MTYNKTIERMTMDNYNVEYLKLTSSEAIERIVEEVTKENLIELLKDGSVTLIKAEIVQ